MKKTNHPYKNQRKSLTAVIVFIFAFLFTFSFAKKAIAQEKNQMLRIAKIKVDPAQLENYHIALKEQMLAAIRLEPGVLMYYALADKKDPSSITIFERYADTSAYNSHIKTPHFTKYKETVKNMVTSLELIDATLIGSAIKPDQ